MAYVVSATWTAEPGKEDVVLDAIEKLTPPSRRGAGQPLLPGLPGPGRARRSSACSRSTTTRTAYAAHGASDHFKQYALEQAIPVLANRERAFFETIG